jgi:hypothetical protein
MEINLDYARKNEGVYYGDGAADLAERVARAAATRSSAKGRAAAVLAALREFADGTGHKPDVECFARPDHGGWLVSYESGPYQWGIVASEALCQVGVFAEPYYSFDLVFYDE